MSTARSSGLRRPCFQNEAIKDLDGRNSSHAPLQLTDFTKASHRRLLLPHDQETTEQDDEDNARTNSHDKKENAADSKKDEPSMNQCVALLEPHLAAFRDRCDALARKHVGETVSLRNDSETNRDENCDEVPSQLLRALLRPAPRFFDLTGSQSASGGDLEPEVELGVTYRLRLAKACWKKGLLAAAEYELLCAAVDNRKRRVEDDDSRENKRRKLSQCEELNLMERVRLALLRLPTEVVTNERATSAWRHAREMLIEFCNQSTYNSNACEDEAICQVAEWALTSWTALVISRGMDACSISSTNQNSYKTSISSIEKQFAILLSNREVSSNTLTLTRSVATRIEDLLSPDNLKLLNGIHLFSLGKLLACFHSSEAAEEHIAKCVEKCAITGGMVGVEQLSRVLAVYACSSSAFIDRGHSSGSRTDEMTMTGLERRLLARFDNFPCLESGSDENRHSRYSSSSKDQSKGKIQSFLKLILHAAAHLIRSRGK
ncbi:hypothetical protein HJC23_008274 [Cyclotella cryptica]|uniref:Uncharacterized protein n=1 Tax=Cyclotella cryptica TaxID=29204 RepID=A0ABD3PCK2_9STRA|eukprot:CCRYP_015907-RA/>CCRYP_015907-RA protein AED:0.09 eAED:0.10 QI:0/0/0/1/1/1/2/0/489